MMKEIFEESFDEYNKYMSSTCPDYWDHFGFETRRFQIRTFIDALNENFNFQKLITFETGASYNPRDGIFGLFLAIATAKTNGLMRAVDINREYVDLNYNLFKNVVPNLDYVIFQNDSLRCIDDLTDVPNLVHLDSWDLNLKDPFPSALYGWREFVAIESKMPSDSIIVIDDNYIQGTWVDWHYSDGRIERLDTIYPIIGKGANVYHHVLSGESNWKLIGNHYNIHNNIKIIIQKQ